ncbi:MAG: hypothetical protein AB8G96_12475 [Phycisphaerales bacterium]
MHDLSDIRRLTAAAGRRLAAGRFLRGLHVVGVGVAIVALVLAVADRLGTSDFVPWLWTWIALGAVAVVGAIVVARRDRPSELAVAVAVDERLGLRERLSNALQAGGDAAGRNDGFSRAVIADGLVAARDPRTRESLGRRFPVRGPRNAWLAPLFVVIAVVMLQLPQTGLIAAADEPEVDEIAAETAREEATAAIEMVSKSLKESPELDGELGDLAEQLSLDGDLADDLKKPEDIKRDAIKKLTDVSERLEEILSSEDAQSMAQVENMLAQLEPADGPGAELSNALRKADFKAAREALEDMLNDVQNGEMSPEAQEQLAEQLQQMAEQMQQMADQQDALEQALKQAGLDPQLANNPQAMQQAIEQAESLNDQQKQQLQQQMQAMQQAKQTMQQMAGMCQNMGQSMGQKGQQGQSGQQGQGQQGQQGQMGQSGQAMSQQLSDMEAMQQMMNQAQAMLGQCQGQKQGLGAPSMSGKMGQNGGQQGSGALRNDVQAAPGKTVMQKEEVPMMEGEVIARMLVDGEPITGEAKARIRDVVRAQSSGFDEAIDESPLPRRYHDAVKHYFGQLEERVQAVETSEAAPAPAPAPAGDS